MKRLMMIICGCFANLFDIDIDLLNLSTSTLGQVINIKTSMVDKILIHAFIRLAD